MPFPKEVPNKLLRLISQYIAFLERQGKGRQWPEMRAKWELKGCVWVVTALACCPIPSTSPKSITDAQEVGFMLQQLGNQCRDLILFDYLINTMTIRHSKLCEDGKCHHDCDIRRMENEWTTLIKRYGIYKKNSKKHVKLAWLKLVKLCRDSGLIS